MGEWYGKISFESLLRKISQVRGGMTSMEFAQEELQLKPAAPQGVPFRLSPLGFLCQGTQTLAEGGYKLSKHRHHVIQRTHGFCKHSALGYRQY